MDASGRSRSVTLDENSPLTCAHHLSCAAKLVLMPHVRHEFSFLGGDTACTMWRWWRCRHTGPWSGHPGAEPPACGTVRALCTCDQPEVVETGTRPSTRRLVARTPRPLRCGQQHPRQFCSWDPPHTYPHRHTHTHTPNELDKQAQRRRQVQGFSSGACHGRPQKHCMIRARRLSVGA